MAAFDMIGQIALFAGAYTPRHWKRCDGSILNIVEYRALFDIIGDTYGGNGTTTFALPNLGGRYMVCVQGVRPNLRPEEWDEILPPGDDAPESGALGTGFTSGGGSGTIPSGTIANRGSASLRFTGDYDETAALYYENAPILNRVEVNQDGFFFRATDEDHTINFSAESGGNGTFEASSATVVFNARSGGIINFSNNVSNLSFDNGNGKVVFTDGGATPLGIEYSADYSATIAANPRSIPDVGGVELISGRIYRATATLNFGSTAAGQSSDLTVAVIGASVGDPVSVGLPAAPDANSCFTAWVSAADTVTVRFNNYSAGAIDPASGTYKVIVSKY